MRQMRCKTVVGSKSKQFKFENQINKLILHYKLSQQVQIHFMNKSNIHIHNTQSTYNWQGVLEFLYGEYQHTSQKQNIWALERNSLKENIKELQGKIIALENINKELKNRNNILEHALRQMKIKNHEQRNKQNEFQNQANTSDANQHIIEQLPKVPQRRPKPNKANLSKMLCSLGIPELLEDIKKDLHNNTVQNLTSTQPRPQTKKGFQLDLSKMEAEPRNSEGFEKKIVYEVVTTLEGHHDGVRDAVFLNYNNELKQVVSASEDLTLKVWQVKKNSFNKIEKVQCIQTIRDHSGPIFTCVEGDGYVFTGGMEGTIRAYNFKNHSKDKKQLLMKWKTDDEQKLQPLWQLLYDKTNKLLVATASQMPIKAYKIPEIQDEKISSNLKLKPYCQFLYEPRSGEKEEMEEYIPTAVCLFNSNLVVSYFNSNSLVHYDIESQKIVSELSYKIEANLSANKLISHPRCVIGAYEDCNIRIFDEKKVVQCFRGHKEPVMGISLNWNNANSLFSCSQDGSVRLWDMRKLKEHVWESMGHQRKNDEAAHFIHTNFDGTCISGGADSLLKIYAPVI